MKKQLIAVILSATFSFGVLTACNKENEEPVMGEIFQTPLSSEMLTLTTMVLEPVKGVKATEIEWDSSDSSIVYVSNGTLYAIAEGKAEITASYDGQEQSYSINAVKNKADETLALSFCVGQNYTVANDFVLPNFPSEDIEISYASSAPTVVAVENATLKAVAKGTATVTASVYETENLICKKTISCLVDNNIGIYTDKTSYELFISDTVGSYTFEKMHTIDSVVYEDGQIIEATVVWKSLDEEVVSMSASGEMTAVKVGSTFVQGEYTSDTGIVVKTQPIPVEVSIPIVQTNDLFVIRKSDVLTFSSEEIFSNSDSIGTLQNVATGETYDLTENKMPARMLEGNEYRFIAYAENGLYGYEADYIFADLLVKTKEDLQNIQKDYPTGYVVLMNNIENVGAYTCKAKASDTAFSGTLNGLGHIISGLSISGWQTGLFSRVVDATVKNIAFEDMTITGGSVGLLGYTGNGKILLENLYMEYSFPKVGGDNSGLLDVLYGGGDLCLRNCLLIANGIDKDENRVFSAISSRPSGNMKFENSYVITQGYLCADLMRTAARFNEAEFVFQTKDAFIEDKTLASTLIDLSTYNEKYWDLTQGVPCFKR